MPLTEPLDEALRRTLATLKGDFGAESTLHALAYEAMVWHRAPTPLAGDVAPASESRPPRKPD